MPTDETSPPTTPDQFDEALRLLVNRAVAAGVDPEKIGGRLLKYRRATTDEIVLPVTMTPEKGRDVLEILELNHDDTVQVNLPVTEGLLYDLDSQLEYEKRLSNE